MNLKAGLPLVNQSQVRDAELRLAQHRRAMASQEMASAQSYAKSQPSLVNAEPSVAVSPAASGAAAGVAAGSPRPAVTPVGKTNPREAAAASPSTPPKASLVATGTPLVVAENNQPLQPFLTASPTPATSGRVEVWQTYRPGQMPRGRLLDVDQTTELADKGIGNATIYLRGDFTVTAARENRAVLRPRQSLADHVLNRGNARIIVEYSRGTPTPREGETFQRAMDRPFQIMDVRRGADGQINIYVREVTSAE
ncbi:MAG: hypothetical protein JO298_03320 [Verrucomicrobia bacterium]|nr:hypothetical protein [Verrucomicrobiota bacterium]